MAQFNRRPNQAILGSSGDCDPPDDVASSPAAIHKQLDSVDRAKNLLRKLIGKKHEETERKKKSRLNAFVTKLLGPWNLPPLPDEMPTLTAESLQNESDLPAVTLQLLRQCTTLTPKSDSLTLERITGAMTNVVYSVNCPDLDPILLRVYGAGTKLFFSRESELAVFRFLSDRGLGPRLLGLFEGGRFEEFLQADPLTKNDLRDKETLKQIAKAMAQLHSLAILPASQLPDLPHKDCQASCLYDRLDQWKSVAERLAADWLAEGKTLGRLDSATLFTEIDDLKGKLMQLPTKIVFAHNDAQYGNILRDRNDGRLILIDYEYCGFADRGFDIGNHFCEWAADYHSDKPHVLHFDSYPTEQEQRLFVREYLLEYRRECKRHLSSCSLLSPTFAVPSSPRANQLATGVQVPSNLDDQETEEEMIAEPSEASSSTTQAMVDEMDEEEEEIMIKRICAEANAFSLASHLQWALWGIIQGTVSTIDFDFFEYGAQRMDEYLRCKDKYLHTAKEVLCPSE